MQEIPESSSEATCPKPNSSIYSRNPASRSCPIPPPPAAAVWRIWLAHSACPSSALISRISGRWVRVKSWPSSFIRQRMLKDSPIAYFAF